MEAKVFLEAVELIGSYSKLGVMSQFNGEDVLVTLGRDAGHLCVRLVPLDQQKWVSSTGLPLLNGGSTLGVFFRCEGARTTDTLWGDGTKAPTPWPGRNKMRWITPFDVQVTDLPMLTPEQAGKFERAEIEQVIQNQSFKLPTRLSTVIESDNVRESINGKEKVSEYELSCHSGVNESSVEPSFIDDTKQRLNRSIHISTDTREQGALHTPQIPRHPPNRPAVTLATSSTSTP